MSESRSLLPTSISPAGEVRRSMGMVAPSPFECPAIRLAKGVVYRLLHADRQRGWLGLPVGYVLQRQLLGRRETNGARINHYPHLPPRYDAMADLQPGLPVPSQPSCGPVSLTVPTAASCTIGP